MSGKSKTPRRLRKVRVSLVSLVSEGANLQPAILKNKGTVELKALTKMGTRGLLHALVAVPNVLDDHGDWQSPEDVEFSAHYHAESGAPLDLQHDLVPLTKDKAVMVEEFILQAQDARFAQVDNAGRPVKHEGAWAAIIKIKDPELLAKATAGELAEVSLYAAAGEYETSNEAPPESHEEPSMTPEEIAKAVADAMSKALAPLTEAVTKALAPPPAPPKPEPKVEPPPAPTHNEDGSPIAPKNITDRMAMLKYKRALEDYQLAKEFAGEMGDAKAVQQLVQCQEALAKSRAKEDVDAGISSVGGQSMRKSLLATSRDGDVDPADSTSLFANMKPTDQSTHDAVMAIVKARKSGSQKTEVTK